MNNCSSFNIWERSIFEDNNINERSIFEDNNINDRNLFEDNNINERSLFEDNNINERSLFKDNNINERSIFKDNIINKKSIFEDENELEHTQKEIINQELFIEENSSEFKKIKPKEILSERDYSSSKYSTREKSENIFQVKKRGRKSKTYNPMNQTNQKEHTKLHEDNRIRKIRIYLINFANGLLNNCLKKEFGTNTDKQIRGIVSELTSDITISFNKRFFKSTLEKIFSNPLNEKYKKYGKDKNINEIKEIRKKINEAPLINELLNKTLIEVYDWFIEKDNYKYFYDRYGKDGHTLNLKEILNELKKNEKSEYMVELENTGMNLLNFFNKTARNVIKKRKIKFKGTGFEGLYEKGN